MVNNPVYELSAVTNQPLISISMSSQESRSSCPPSGTVAMSRIRPQIRTMSNRGRSGSYSLKNSVSYRKYTQTSTWSHVQIRTIVMEQNGERTAIISSWNFNQVTVTKKYLLALPEFRSLPVEQKASQFLEMVSSSSRLKPLMTIVNFQEWTENAEGTPILLFNADSTHGQYKYNKGITKVFNEIIVEFVKKNPDMGFILEYRSGKAEHPNQKNQLESILLSQRESGTYQLDKSVHNLKTKELNNIMPSGIKTIPEWLIYNGEETINFLQKEWNEGRLTKSVESFDMFNDAIRNCIQLDIDNFKKTGLPDTATTFPGHIRSVSMGANDCARFNRLVATSDWETVDVRKVEDFSIKLLIKAQLRAAYIHKGMHLFPEDSRAHQTQLYDSQTFITNLTRLVTTLEAKLPHLLVDASFQNEWANFKEVLAGRGTFNKIVTGTSYKNFTKELNNPKAQLSLFPRSGTIHIKS